MPLINNTTLFPISSFVTGCTMIGSLADGTTVQFDFAAMVAMMNAEGDVMHYSSATKIGQTVVANQDAAAIDFPSINNGKKFIGVLNTFPATLATHFDMIYKVLL